LFDETLKAFRAHDALTDMEKVERLFNEYRADDLGVAGVTETLAALSNGQVEEMLIVNSAEKLQYDEEEVKKVLELYQVDEELPAELDQRMRTTSFAGRRYFHQRGLRSSKTTRGWNRSAAWARCCGIESRRRARWCMSRVMQCRVRRR
jgi:hypothetical protein